MMMKDYMTPDHMFGHYWEITPEFLLSLGIKGLLTDVDNTLAPYEQALPDERLKEWLRSLRQAGIGVALVSNNHGERIEKFNAELGLPAFPDSHKPGKKMLFRAMEALGTDVGNTAMLGDQLFTDCYAGKHIGLPALIVPPIKDKTNLFFKSKRFLERKYIRRFAKRRGYAEWMSFWNVRKPLKKEKESL